MYEGRLYTGTRDCIQKVAQHEGIYGFYRGITPQVVGVALGKAIKLSVSKSKITDLEQWVIQFFLSMLRLI